MTPRRIQRMRTKGWRMPPGALYIGRPGRFGNPFPVGPTHAPRQAVARFRAMLAGRWARLRKLMGPGYDNEAWDIALFILQLRRRDILDHLGDLRGHDLACWCKEGDPYCHGLVLLRLANRDKP